MARNIDVECLIPDKDNRKESGALETIATVKDLGVLSPLLVVPGDKSGQYLVIDGHRRLKSAIDVGLKKVPCEILKPEQAEQAKYIANLDRRNLSPLDEFNAIKQLQTIGYDSNSIGNILGISRYQVNKRLKFDNLIPEFKEQLQKGDLSIDSAMELAIVDADIQRKINNTYTSFCAITLPEQKRVIKDYLGFHLYSVSEDLFNEPNKSGGNCALCEYNNQSNNLFYEDVEREESICSNRKCAECISWKLVSMFKKFECSSFVDTWRSGLFKDVRRIIVDEYGYKIVDNKYPQNDEPNLSLEGEEKVLTLTGEIKYQGGKPIAKELDQEELKRKELFDALDDTISKIKICVERIFDFLIEGRINTGERIFMSDEVLWTLLTLADKAFFAVLATTGMRRAEAAALCTAQIRDIKGIKQICINRAKKDTDWNSIGLPKMNIVRTIPIADVTYKAIEPFLNFKDPHALIFPNITPQMLATCFKRIRALAPIELDLFEPDAIEFLSPHILRHSLNTALILENANNILIQEYLSWHHQDLGTQQGYTHIYARNLLPIANLIEKMFGEEKSLEDNAPRGKLRIIY